MINEINFFVSNFVFLSSALVFKCWAPWGSKSGFPRNLEEVWDLQPQNSSLVHPSLLHHQSLIFHLHPMAPLFHIEADHQHPGSDQLFQLQSKFKEESDQYQDLRNFYIQQSSLSPQVSVFLWVSGSFFFCSSSSRSWVREGGQPCHRTTIRGSIAKIPRL